jgi:hypothetical protein
MHGLGRVESGAVHLRREPLPAASSLLVPCFATLYAQRHIGQQAKLHAGTFSVASASVVASAAP